MKKLKLLKQKHFKEKMYSYALDGFMMVCTELSSTIHIKERWESTINRYMVIF